MRWLPLVICGCGRINFDPTGDAGGTPADSPIPPGQMVETFGETPTATHSGVTEDTYLSFDAPMENFGSDVVLDIDVAHSRTLLRFLVETIPTGVTVQAATLSVSTTGNGGADGSQFEIYVIEEPWRAGESTLMEAKTGAPWTASDPPLRSQNAIASVIPDQKLTRYTVQLEVAAVQAWIDDKTTNFGLALLDSDGCELESSESPIEDARPELAIRYSISSSAR